MPRPSLDVTRAEINLYTKDKATMMKHYGPGWTAMVRELVQNHCRMIRTNVVESMNRLMDRDLTDD